jgi:hypothetical protein
VNGKPPPVPAEIQTMFHRCNLPSLPSQHRTDSLRAARLDGGFHLSSGKHSKISFGPARSDLSARDSYGLVAVALIMILVLVLYQSPNRWYFAPTRRNQSFFGDVMEEICVTAVVVNLGASRSPHQTLARALQNPGFYAH